MCFPFRCTSVLLFFFSNDTATTEIYTLSLHDALPISKTLAARDENLAFILAAYGPPPMWARKPGFETLVRIDRKSTRLNSSHANISYAVFCLKKKKK